MISIQSIRQFLNDSSIKYEYVGNNDINIRTYSLPDKIENNSILWVKNPQEIEKYDFSQYIDILVVTSHIDKLFEINGNFLLSDNSKELFFSILNEFYSEVKEKNFIGKSSKIETHQIGKNVYIGHNCYIGPRVIIKDDVIINNNVTIEGSVIIGDNTIINSGAVVGADGYGYYQNDKGENVKVPHLGGVVIGNNVEIGANTCIDKGTLGNTIIEDNVKIDNLCHIAHNVQIRRNANVIALSMIAGSVQLEENSYIAPSASIMNQLTVGKNSVVGLGAVVIKDVDDDVVVAGVPAKVIRKLDGK